ncbi:hypothetical protein QQX98_000846 [Neonectria punicea]|uniref:Uncharacterized protein n=1 Tax=Neonectria punicea TaxID=979145 RepID=A0ABR1HR86_9HYPO
MSKIEPQEIEHGGQNSLPFISEEHREYLIQRHGTANLDPLPHMDDDDPLNWPERKKLVNLSLISFHAFMATFTAAAIQSAFVNIAEDLHVTVHKATYLTSLVNAVQFILYFFLGPESRYVPTTAGQQPQATTFRQKFLHFRAIDPTPLKFIDFLQPLILLARPYIAIPAASHAMIFL